MNELIKNRLSNTKINWENHPFPYAIIDNFLPDEVFKKITDGLQDVNKFQDLKKKFSSHVELNKKVYGDRSNSIDSFIADDALYQTFNSSSSPKSKKSENQAQKIENI